MAFFKRYAPEMGAMLLIFCSVWVLRWLLLGQYPVPEPIGYDDRCYVFAAQTFADGKLFYEQLPHNIQPSVTEVNILDTPVRASRCLVAMSVFLWAGLKIFGHMHWGAVLLMSLALTGMYWGLRGWIRLWPALLITLYFVILFRAPHYFINSYFGGGHVLLGTFLVAGSYPRIVYQKKYWCSITMALGMIFLGASRPFEGGILSLCTLGALTYQYYINRAQHNIANVIYKVLLPFIGILLPFITANLYYNYVITGNLLTMPYALHAQQREIARVFWFLPLNETARSSHWAIASWQNWNIDATYYDRTQQIFIFMPLMLSYLWGLSFFVDIINYNYIFIFLLLFLCIRYAVSSYLKHCAIIILFCTTCITWLIFEHYFVVSGMLLLLCIAHSLYRHNAPQKSWFVHIFLAIIALAAIMTQPNREVSQETYLKQQKIVAALPKQQQHIVFVNQQYEAEKHIRQVYLGYVHNAPNLAESRIIWAWHLSPQQNAQLIAAYPQRQVWYWEPAFTHDGEVKNEIFKPYVP